MTRHQCRECRVTVNARRNYTWPARFDEWAHRANCRGWLPLFVSSAICRTMGWRG